MWLNLGLQTLDRRFTIATYLKLCNILLGMMSHSSCHPCCRGDVEKSDLRGKWTQRTIASLNSLLWDYFEANTNKKEAKHYDNVIHLPIVSDNLDDNTPVIELLPPSELQLLITLYDGLEKIWPRREDWLKLCNVKKVEYHGGKFEGNDSRALLKKVDQIECLCPTW